MTSSTSITGSKVGRARRNPGQLWQVPAFVLGLCAFVGVAVSAPWRLTPQERDFENELTFLRHGLESEADGDVLVAHAEGVLLRLPMFAARAAEVHFLAGSAYYRQAQQKQTMLAKGIWPHAAELLEKSQSLGVADGDRPALQYRLGFSLYQQEKEAARALELMMQSAEKGAEHPLAAYQMLVQAQLQRTPPNVDAALSASQRVLDLTPMREVEAAALAHLLHAELLLRKEQRREAFKTLEPIGANAPQALRVKARLLQARACKEDGLWEKAAPIWKQLLSDESHVEGGRARIEYELGWCHHKMKPANYAETMRVWSEALSLGGPAGQAAGLSLGEMRLSMGEKQAAQALADWKRALADVHAPADFKNPYLKLADVKEMFEHAISQFEEEQDAEKTQLVAELFRKIAPGGIAELRIARAAEGLAKHKHEQLAGKVGAVTEAEVSAQFRRAGEAYEHAAQAGAEADRPEALWRGIQCYLSAKDSVQAQKMLQDFVRYEKDESRVAEGWCIRGDLYRAEGRKLEAQESYKKCLQYGNATPFAYRSRYHLAVDKIEEKKYTEARDILEQNLAGPGETDRPSQEKSQYQLATLLMLMEDHDKAEVHLKECLRLYPENPNALLARARLGECYRKLAHKEMAKEKEWRDKDSLELTPERRQQLQENVRHVRNIRIERLNEAVKTYEKLSDDLERMASAKSLSPLEQMLARRALFSIGECYHDNEQFDQALNAFKKVQTRHRKSLESFYASGSICNLVNLVRPPAKEAERVRVSALESVRLLIEDVKALPPEHEVFTQPNVPSRDQWLSWAEDTQRKLLAPPKKDSGSRPFP